jgi:hypothetical protein
MIVCSLSRDCKRAFREHKSNVILLCFILTVKFKHAVIGTGEIYNMKQLLYSKNKKKKVKISISRFASKRSRIQLLQSCSHIHFYVLNSQYFCEHPVE